MSIYGTFFQIIASSDTVSLSRLDRWLISIHADGTLQVHPFDLREDAEAVFDEIEHKWNEPVGEPSV